MKPADTEMASGQLELDPCRHCGNTDLLIMPTFRFCPSFQLRCRCGMQTSEYPTREAVQAVWNYQAPKDDAYLASSWVPVSKRLPEDGVRVLIYLRVGSVETARLKDGGSMQAYWRIGDAKATPHSASHWMPLPKPPLAASGTTANTEEEQK